MSFADKLAGVKENSRFRVLFVGDKNLGKTSLAFKLAFDHASKGGRPLFICNKNKIEVKLPLIVNYSGSQTYSNWSSDVLSQINMKYISSITELKALIAGLQCFEPRPSAVIIDDFSLFVDPLFSVSRHDPKFLDHCITVGAFVNDVVNHLEKQTSGSNISTTTGNMAEPLLNNGIAAQNGTVQHKKHIQLILTDDCQDPLFLNIMRRCVDSVFALQRTSPSSVQLLYRGDSASAASGAGGHNPNQQIRGAGGDGQQQVVYENIRCSNNVLYLT